MGLSAPHTLLEICIDSVDGALAAAASGADRVELCANLLEGGTTPSTGMVRSVLAAMALPVMVMVRPRGGHFTYARQERSVMLSEAEALLELPIAGLVIGALTTDGAIDLPLCRTLVRMAQGKSVTFHRAFDQIAEPLSALDQLVDLQVARVLSSGQAPSAAEGVENLRDWQTHVGERLSIMPGCGVRAHNVRSIVEQVGAREVHCSASALIDTRVAFWRTNVPMTSAPSPHDLARRVTDSAQVAAIRAELVARDTDASAGR